jgi:flagellar hook-basal body complex protein FliE
MKLSGIEALNLTKPIQEMNLIDKTSPSFADWLTDSLKSTNSKLIDADQSLQQLASGQTESLHHMMLTLETAKLSFQYLEQIRNRLMSAYQDILREQI